MIDELRQTGRTTRAIHSLLSDDRNKLDKVLYVAHSKAYSEELSQKHGIKTVGIHGLPHYLRGQRFDTIELDHACHELCEVRTIQEAHEAIAHATVAGLGHLNWWK